MDLQKIKEAVALSSDAGEDCRCSMCVAAKKYLAEQVPNLIAEIERLTKAADVAGFACLVCTRTAPTREGFEHVEGCIYRVMKDGAS